MPGHDEGDQPGDAVAFHVGKLEPEAGLIGYFGGCLRVVVKRVAAVV